MTDRQPKGTHPDATALERAALLLFSLNNWDAPPKRAMMHLTMQNRKAYKPLDNRYTERVTLTCQVRYLGEIPSQPHRGEGLMKNLSLSGCQIVSARGVTRGTLLTLNMALPDGLPLLVLKSAHVVWVSGCQFSVRFMDLDHDQRRRIQTFIWKSISRDNVSHQRSRLRLV